MRIGSTRAFVSSRPCGPAAALAVLAVGLSGGSVAWAQDAGPYGPDPRGSANVKVVAHLPLGAPFTVGDVEVEQEAERPYAYVSRWSIGGVDIVDLGGEQAEVVYRWRIEDPDLHTGAGGTDGKYFKLDGRYYYVQGLQFAQGTPDADLGAVVFDVTGLPDSSRVEEVGRIRTPESPGGFHNLFAYKHSDGRVLLFTTVDGSHANVYDMESFLSGGADQGLVARIDVPENPCPRSRPSRTWHDFYVAYHPASDQDRFYGAAQPAGAYVMDVTDPTRPRLLTAIACAHGVTRDHTIQASPDGRWAIQDSHLRYNPIRIYDLEPGLEGEVEMIQRPVGAWTANYRKHAHNQEMRWPYVFVANYMEGLQIFNMRDPENPYGVGHYHTYDGPEDENYGGDSFFVEVTNGAFGVDVRNVDGLIVVNDFTTGFWAFRLEGFDGWSGESWGMPDISSAQNWDGSPREVR